MIFMDMQTLPMQVIKQAIVEVIKNDTNINDFCQNKYGKFPVILNALPLKSPDASMAPYILIYDSIKNEGLNVYPYLYSFSVGWGVENKNVTTNDRVTIYHGQDEADELGQLIIECINRRHVIHEVNYETVGPINPNHSHWMGAMDVVWQIEYPMGIPITF